MLTLLFLLLFFGLLGAGMPIFLVLGMCPAAPCFFAVISAKNSLTAPPTAPPLVRKPPSRKLPIQGIISVWSRQPSKE